MVNPVSWFDSVVWGQVDSVGVVFLLLGLRELWRDRPERAAFFTVVAALIKPQLGILIPLLIVVTIRRAFWPVHDPASDETDEPDASSEPGAAEPEVAGEPNPAAGPLTRLAAAERRTGHPIRILTTALVGVVTTFVLCAPFGLSVIEITSTAPFFKSELLDPDLRHGVGLPVPDGQRVQPVGADPGGYGKQPRQLGAVGLRLGRGVSRSAGRAWRASAPSRPSLVGSLAMLAVVAIVSVVAARRPDRLTLLLGLTILAIAFYVVPTRVHERYAYPAIALAVILAAIAWRWRGLYLALSVTVFLNMYAALTNPFYNNPGDLRLARDRAHAPHRARRSRSWPSSTAVIFLWAFAQLRPSAMARLADELEDASAEPLGGRGRVGRAAGRRRVDHGRDHRHARSRRTRENVTLAPGRRGRRSRRRGCHHAALDRPRHLRRHRHRRLVQDPLQRPADPARPDARRSVMKAAAASTGSTCGSSSCSSSGRWCCAPSGSTEPLQMHFDEVYHARTATEFLQDWRYGLSHDIYEWTHPHLAKYLMAAGIVLWGEDHVSATSDLEVPVVASVGRGAPDR